MSRRSRRPIGSDACSRSTSGAPRSWTGRGCSKAKLSAGSTCCRPSSARTGIPCARRARPFASTAERRECRAAAPRIGEHTEALRAEMGRCDALTRRQRRDVDEGSRHWRDGVHRRLGRPQSPGARRTGRDRRICRTTRCSAALKGADVRTRRRRRPASRSKLSSRAIPTSRIASISPIS